MNPFILSHSAVSAKALPKQSLRALIGTCLMTGHVLTAQSAENLQVPASPPASTTETATAPAETSTNEENTGTNVPSRFITAETVDAYLASVSSVLSMRQRAHDPFGQLQDPSAKPILKPSASTPLRRIAKVQTTPFSDIVRLIKVTTIMPGEKRFLVGNRQFKQGDRIPMMFRMKKISAEVVSVRSNQIDFRNVDTGEKASLTINLLPAGMTPGSGGISAPGMVANRPDAPLNLDQGNP